MVKTIKDWTQTRVAKSTVKRLKDKKEYFEKTNPNTVWDHDDIIVSLLDDHDVTVNDSNTSESDFNMLKEVDHEQGANIEKVVDEPHEGIED